jgi:hypothetical protein
MIQYYLFRVLATVNLDTSSLPNSNPNVVDAPSSFLASLLQIVFGVTGSVALLMIVISGFRYVIASGEPAAVAKARSTILYAIIGLAVALTGFSIVTFVVMRVA